MTRAPAAAPLVAVLSKRGRFLTAHPLFPLREDDSAPGHGRRRTGGLVVEAGRRGAASARDGDIVLVQPAASGRARVDRVIGRPDVARDVIEAMLLDRGLRRRFDPAVEREARTASERGLEPGGPDGAASRHDLRDLPTFTIDPASARDFDDAISADGDRVWVHIADVSAYVPPGSRVDREAHRRGTSVYVPGTVEPMLPEPLSNHACSLVPDQDRLAVTVELELHGAEVRRSSFYRSIIRSDARLDYDRVDRIFAGDEAPAEPWASPLAAARRAAAALDEARERRRGILTLDTPEPEFSFDEKGHVADVRDTPSTESHRLIEHLMIAANEAVARLLFERGVPALYRVHERPDPERVERLVDQLASLGVATPPMPKSMSSTQAAEVLGECSTLVEAHVRRTGRGRLGLTLLVLRALKQAYYSPENLGHAGLASSSYCHFTSPIRRYPDLVCHRALLSAVGGGESAPRASSLSELGSWCSDRERFAMTVERDGDDIARCFALERVLYEQGWDVEFDGEVTGLIGAGAFVTFGGGRYEGLLPVRRMHTAMAGGGRGERDWWELNEQGTILRGERTDAVLRLGDPVEVRVRQVEPVRGRVDLGPV